MTEVAAELERSPGAVHMLRSRAHDRLKKLFGGPAAFFFFLWIRRERAPPTAPVP